MTTYTGTNASETLTGGNDNDTLYGGKGNRLQHLGGCMNSSTQVQHGIKEYKDAKASHKSKSTHSNNSDVDWRDQNFKRSPSQEIKKNFSDVLKEKMR